MTIKRQYILPNCTLTLEGFGDNTQAEAEESSESNSISILVNAECHFVGSDRSLSGGGVFFENLVRAVSTYAQEFLSGLSHPHQSQTDYPIVKIESLSEQRLHRLSVDSEAETGKENVAIDLTTVQLFDLVEAIDQVLSDRNTLPDLSFHIQPISRRYRKPEEPLVERVTPIAVGVGSLAIAAAAFWMIPPPEIREPKPQPGVSPTETLPTTPQSQPPITPPQ
ncbi:MAG: DUF4335 domain-containing protein [Stanieria sp.]|jgi:hypothetical protein